MRRHAQCDVMHNVNTYAYSDGRYKYIASPFSTAFTDAEITWRTITHWLAGRCGCMIDDRTPRDFRIWKRLWIILFIFTKAWIFKINNKIQVRITFYLTHWPLFAVFMEAIFIKRYINRLYLQLQLICRRCLFAGLSLLLTFCTTIYIFAMEWGKKR